MVRGTSCSFSVLLRCLLFFTLIFCFVSETCLTVKAEETEKLSDMTDRLFLGTSGEEVKMLQERLKELGYYLKSIDGDYGNGTKTAVESFQARNGLNVDGIASQETIEAMESDDAVPAPTAPALELTSVSFDAYNAYFNLTNHTEKIIDKFELHLLTYGAGGDITINYDELSLDNLGLTAYYTIEEATVRPEETISASIYIQPELSSNTKYIGLYMDNYHTTDGYSYAYSPSQAYVFKSNGSIEFPTDETEPDELSDAFINDVKTIKTGMMGGIISKWVTDKYAYPEGRILLDVTEGGLAFKAGLKKLDVITSLDGRSAVSGHAFTYAWKKFENGEKVPVTYVRNGIEYTTVFTKELNSSVNENDDELELEDDDLTSKLSDLAELFEKGLLTEEEFETAKKKILG